MLGYPPAFLTGWHYESSLSSCMPDVIYLIERRCLFISCKNRQPGLVVLFTITRFLPVLFFRCAQRVWYYFYDGTALPSLEVATAVLHGDLLLLRFDNTAMTKFSKTYDMPPGKHRLEFFTHTVPPLLGWPHTIPEGISLIWTQKPAISITSTPKLFPRTRGDRKWLSS